MAASLLYGCVPTQDESTRSLTEALGQPNIVDFTVVPNASAAPCDGGTSNDPNKFKIDYHVEATSGMPDEFVYIEEDTVGGGPIFFAEQSAPNVHLSADYDVGFRDWCSVNDTCPCKHMRAQRGGYHRLTLGAHYAGDFVSDHMSFDLFVPYTVVPPTNFEVWSFDGANWHQIVDPGAPYRIQMDVGAPAQTYRVKWQLPIESFTPAPPRFVRIVKGTDATNPTDDVNNTKQYDINYADLTQPLNQYQFYYCEAPEPTDWRETCSPPVTVTFEKRVFARSTNVRTFVQPNNPATVTWTGAGPYFKVTANDLLSPVCSASNSFTLSGVSSGVHEIRIQSCTDAACTACRGTVNRKELVTTSTAHPTFQYYNPTSYFARSVSKLYERPSTGDLLDVTFDAGGNVWGIGEYATAATYVGRYLPVDGWTGLKHFQIPLAQDISRTITDGRTTFYDTVKPFGGFVLDANGTRIAGGLQRSALGERVVDTGPYTLNDATKNIVWFTQGGVIGTAPKDYSYSRIIGFRRDGAVDDDPTTAWDDRFCVIHVPGPNKTPDPSWSWPYGASQGAGAQVYGIDWDGYTRMIWIAKSNFGNWLDNTQYGVVKSQLAAFDPSKWIEQIPGTQKWKWNCPDSMLDYADDNAVNDASFYNDCAQDLGQNGKCLKQWDVPVPDITSVPRIYQIEAEPTASQYTNIWYTASYNKYNASPPTPNYSGGGVLGFFRATGQGDLVSGTFNLGHSEENPSPPAMLPPSYHVLDETGVSALGAYPWQLRVGGDYVYVSRFMDRDIVRVNKTTYSKDSLPVSLFGEETKVHSLALEKDQNGNPIRLWFTLSNPPEGAEIGASYFGYVKLNSGSPSFTWTTPPTVVIFGSPSYPINWSDPNDASFRLGKQHSFRGIEVRRTATGATEVVLADHGFDEVVVLTSSTQLP